MHRNTIMRLERGGKGETRTLADIRRVFEAAGVDFLEDGDAPGVRYRTRARVTPESGTGNPSPNLDDAAFCCLSARKPCLDAVKLDGSAAL